MFNFIIKELDTEALGEETMSAISVLKYNTDDCVNIEWIEKIINTTKDEILPDHLKKLLILLMVISIMQSTIMFDVFLSFFIIVFEIARDWQNIKLVS